MSDVCDDDDDFAHAIKEVSDCIRSGWKDRHEMVSPEIIVAAPQHYERLAAAIVNLVRINPGHACLLLARSMLRSIEMSPAMREMSGKTLAVTSHAGRVPLIPERWTQSE